MRVASKDTITTRSSSTSNRMSNHDRNVKTNNKENDDNFTSRRTRSQSEATLKQIQSSTHSVSSASRNSSTYNKNQRRSLGHCSSKSNHEEDSEEESEEEEHGKRRRSSRPRSERELISPNSVSKSSNENSRTRRTSRMSTPRSTAETKTTSNSSNTKTTKKTNRLIIQSNGKDNKDTERKSLSRSAKKSAKQDEESHPEDEYMEHATFSSSSYSEEDDHDEDVDFEKENEKRRKRVKKQQQHQKSINQNKNSMATPTSLRYRETAQISALNTPSTSLLENAKKQLHPTARPDFLPCRDEEYYEIAGHLESAIESGKGSCIYISGVPGTGKTATVQSVIKSLLQKRDSKEIADFDYFEVNGMNLTDPTQTYSLLWKQLSGEKTNTTQAASNLDKYFLKKETKRKHPFVLLVDELDQFVNKKQKVIYNLFDWPNRPYSQFIVVAIANTMDLPERVMLNRVSSRIGLTRLNFEPYKYQQLIEIVSSRLQGLDVFQKEAIEICARKVAAVSGDARRALDICRHAIHIVQQGLENNDKNEDQAQVTMKVVQKAIKEITSTPVIVALQNATLHQKLLLASMVKCIRSSGLQQVPYSKIVYEHRLLCTLRSIAYPGTSKIHAVASDLCHVKWIMRQGDQLDLKTEVRLGVLEEDVITMFSKNEDSRLKDLF